MATSSSPTVESIDVVFRSTASVGKHAAKPPAVSYVVRTPPQLPRSRLQPTPYSTVETPLTWRYPRIARPMLRSSLTLEGEPYSR